jgi:DNA-binding CsgD family transcriptional regulator
MDDKQFAELKRRLDVITSLLALQLPSELTTAEKVKALRSAGVGYREIAQVLGTTEKYVYVALRRERDRARDRKE